MNTVKPCKDRFEDMVAFVMGALHAPAAAELQSHLSECAPCRTTFEALQEEEKVVRTGFAALATSVEPLAMAAIERRSHAADVRVRAFRNPSLERIKTMIRSHTRLMVAAASLAVLAACVVFYASLVSPWATPYALGQTAEANNRVTSYHITLTHVKGSVGEVWVQLDQTGNMLARLDFPETEDGPKVVVVSGDRAEVWFKAKNTHLIVTDGDVVKELMKSRALFDPKLAFEQLQADIAAGRVQVETTEPTQQGEPITLTVTSNNDANRRQVYEVDQTTKLVERVASYRRHDDRWEQVDAREYADYNQAIDASIFQPVLPEDIVTIDQINTVVGLAKGELSDNEIAAKVVREFFEALVAEDYRKAGQLYEGIPAEVMKKRLDAVQMKFLNLVEVGEPAPAPDPRMQALRVPVKVEVEAKGEKRVMDFSPFVRQVHKQPGRWGICGGF